MKELYEFICNILQNQQISTSIKWIVIIIVSILVLFFIIFKYNNKENKSEVGKIMNDDNSQNGVGENSKIKIGRRSIVNFFAGKQSHENSDRTNTQENSDNPNLLEKQIKLQKNYTSLFAEDNRLKTEQITITSQENGKIVGDVVLIEKNSYGKEISTYTYSLIGKFANCVLTAEYYSTDGNVDERGAINLKLIDNEILSGFCSFSKTSSADDDIRVSPYVWKAGKDQDLLNGTFDFCTKCYETKDVCCCASEHVDMPIILDSEHNRIKNHLSKKTVNKKSFYSNNLPEPYDKVSIRQIKRIEKNDSESENGYTKCHFFNLDEQKCKIYEVRPLDCRLFPFDIKLSENKSEYDIIYYTDLCKQDLPEFSQMKKMAHILRPYFFLLYPYLHIITSDSVCEKLKSAEYAKIDSFKNFVF